MIVNNQSNLKVHFAGLENQDFAEVLHKCGKIKYSLFTVFPFLAPRLGIKPMKMKTCSLESEKYLSMASEHHIMDSGLFTLMFGAHAGKRSANEIELWYKSLVEFVIENNIKATCVEVDCQKVLGAEAAWKYRIQMKKDLPKTRQINVFHLDDGKNGLDRMIEFSDYIAISVPELRASGKKNYTSQIANYIKNKKPSIDIHLLGCTEMKLLKQLNFCSSSDSTSWQQVNRFGSLKYNNGTKTLAVKNRNINNNKLFELYKEDVKQIISKWVEPTDKRLDYYCKYALAGTLLKQQYSFYAGPQD